VIHTAIWWLHFNLRFAETRLEWDSVCPLFNTNIKNVLMQDRLSVKKLAFAFILGFRAQVVGFDNCSAMKIVELWFVMLENMALDGFVVIFQVGYQEYSWSLAPFNPSQAKIEFQSVVVIPQLVKGFFNNLGIFGRIDFRRNVFVA